MLFQIFENTALKHGKVNLTWDETDPNRLAAMRKAFEADSGDEEDEDVKAYLANSSDEDDEVGLAPFGEEEELGETFFSSYLFNTWMNAIQLYSFKYVLDSNYHPETRLNISFFF